MLALVNTPNGASAAEINEVEEPEPKANETVVGVRAFSLNRGELSLLASRPEGWRPGQDISGIVTREAEDGSGFAVGTRIVGVVDEAGWSERVVVPTDRLAALSDEVSFAQAATLPIAGLTALRALRQGGSLIGRRVLVTGASGGVGRFAVQLAANGGAHVTAVVGSLERGKGLPGLGASEVVTDVSEAGGTFDLALESVGGASLETTMKAMSGGGKVVLFGNSSGEDAKLSLYDFGGVWPGGVEIQIFFYASGEVSFTDDLARLVYLIEAGKLTPEVGSESSWRNLDTVLDDLANRLVKGKAILTVD